MYLPRKMVCEDERWVEVSQHYVKLSTLVIGFWFGQRNVVVIVVIVGGVGGVNVETMGILPITKY